MKPFGQHFQYFWIRYTASRELDHERGEVGPGHGRRHVPRETPRWIDEERLELVACEAADQRAHEPQVLGRQVRRRMLGILAALQRV